MSQTSLAIAKSDYEATFALRSGMGVTEDDWQDDATKVAIIADCVESGQRSFYHCGYQWSFLKPRKSFTLASGDSAILLPDDLGGIIGEIDVSDSDNGVFSPIPRMGINYVDGLLVRYPEQTGSPQCSALTTLENQRQQLVVYPIADQAYVLRFQYFLLPEALSGKREFTYGGAEHHQTVMAAIMAHYELHYRNIQDGPHAQEFRIKLAQSIQMDGRKKPEFIGTNRDNSDDKEQVYIPTRTLVYNGSEIGE